MIGRGAASIDEYAVGEISIPGNRGRAPHNLQVYLNTTNLSQNETVTTIEISRPFCFACSSDDALSAIRIRQAAAAVGGAPTCDSSHLRKHSPLSALSQLPSPILRVRLDVSPNVVLMPL